MHHLDGLPGAHVGAADTHGMWIFWILMACGGCRYSWHVETADTHGTWRLWTVLMGPRTVLFCSGRHRSRGPSIPSCLLQQPEEPQVFVQCCLWACQKKQLSETALEKGSEILEPCHSSVPSEVGSSSTARRFDTNACSQRLWPAWAYPTQRKSAPRHRGHKCTAMDGHAAVGQDHGTGHDVGPPPRHDVGCGATPEA